MGQKVICFKYMKDGWIVLFQRGGRCNDNVGAGLAWANIFGANVLDWTQLLPAFHKDAQSRLSKHLFCRLSSVFISFKNSFLLKNVWNQFVHQKFQFMVNWKSKWIISILRSWRDNKFMFCPFNTNFLKACTTGPVVQALLNYFINVVYFLWFWFSAGSFYLSIKEHVWS